MPHRHCKLAARRTRNGRRAATPRPGAPCRRRLSQATGRNGGLPCACSISYRPTRRRPHRSARAGLQAAVRGLDAREGRNGESPYARSRLPGVELRNSTRASPALQETPALKDLLDEAGAARLPRGDQCGGGAPGTRASGLQELFLGATIGTLTRHASTCVLTCNENDVSGRTSRCASGYGKRAWLPC